MTAAGIAERAALYAEAARAAGLVTRPLSDGSRIVEGSGEALRLNRIAETLAAVADALRIHEGRGWAPETPFPGKGGER